MPRRIKGGRSKRGGGMSETGNSAIIYPEDHLPFGQNLISGLQHVVAMFGGTVLCPILIGFDPNIAILFSGLATLLFYLILQGRVPSYLGSSFSFIAAVITVTGYSGGGPNPRIDIALGGIMAAGALYGLIGLVVMIVGCRWIDRLMPPVLTGAIVAVIGLNLAPVAVNNLNANAFDSAIGLLTIILVGTAAVYLPRRLARLPILIGGGVGYLLCFTLGNVMGFGPAIDFSPVAKAALFGLPHFTTPHFEWSAMGLIAPVALILVAENLGHVRSIGVMTGRSMDGYLGRAFFADGVATMISAGFGGPGVTTYAENMGVMAITRNFSSLTFITAGGFAIILGLSPKFGAMIGTIPIPVLGGLSCVVFGLIAATAGRIWVENKVNFSDPRNLIVVGYAVITAAGDLKLRIGDFVLGGIAMATFGSIFLYHILSRLPNDRGFLAQGPAQE